MEARPTPNMKKGWLCRTSCDKKNHEIAPMVMIQIEWWSRSSDDDPDPNEDDEELNDDPDDT